MSKPHPDDYKMTHLETDFSTKKIFALILSVLLFFVVPIVTIETISSKISKNISDGQVAGVSTTQTNFTNSNVLNLFGVSLNLNSQSGLLILGGVVLFGIAIILIIYLFIDNNAKNKSKS